MTQRRIPQAWLDFAKQQIKECTTKRLYLRIEQLRSVINKTLPSNLPRFIIDESLKNQICQQVLNVIDEYQGFKINNNKFPKTQQEVIKKTRTWWNRIKSSKLASLLFLVICFYVLYNVCVLCKPLKFVSLYFAFPSISFLSIFLFLFLSTFIMLFIFESEYTHYFSFRLL